MRFASSFAGLLPVLTLSLAAPSELKKTPDVNSFIVKERPIALQGALNNIGPDGSQVSGAGAYIVASPSTTDPNCEISCTFPPIMYAYKTRFLHLDPRFGFDYENDNR
jgi:hypothetical protein